MRLAKGSLPWGLEAASGALLVLGLVGGMAWWSSAVVAPRDRLLLCGSNTACREAALRDFPAHRAVSARLDSLTR